MATSTITLEQLKEFGMTQPEGIEAQITPLRKIIGRAGDNDSESISIVITREYNTNALALKLPDGATIFLNCNTIEELIAFEKCIASWSPNY